MLGDFSDLSKHLNLLEKQLISYEGKSLFSSKEPQIKNTINQIAQDYLNAPQLLEQHKEELGYVVDLYQRSCKILNSSDPSLSFLVEAVGKAILFGVKKDGGDSKAFIDAVKVLKKPVLEALWLASKANDPVGMKALLDVGENGSEVLFRAAQENNTGIIKALMKAGVGHSEVIERASQENNHVVVRTLLRNVPMEATTALVIAARNGYVDIVRELLRNGTATFSTNARGLTPLMIAAGNGRIDVVEVLIDARAEVDRSDEAGTTALMLAAVKGHTDVVKALIGSGAVVDKEGFEGTTALMLAAVKGHTDVVKALIGSGAVVDKEISDGMSALKAAARSGYADVVKVLIDGGAVVDKASSDGTTALMLAASNGHRIAADILLKEEELSEEEVRNLVELAITDLPSRKKALAWAKGVFSYYVHFKIAEDFLLQEAMKTILWLEGNQNDAYYIHACIRQKKAEYPDPMQAIIPIPIRECGSIVTLNASGLMEGLHKAPTFQEFKARIEKFNQTIKSKPFLDSDVFRSLFTNLLTRLAVELKKDPLNARLIEKKQEAKIAAEPFIQQGQRIFELMKEPFDNDGAYVPLNVEKLYSIAEILLQKKDALEGLDLLTAREDLMMAWLPLITNCGTGQEEGISLCYHYLNINQEKSSQTNEIDEDAIIGEGKAKEGELYITTIVQAAMESVVISPKTFEQFQVNVTSLDQQVHLTKYLRNMIGPESGMSCEDIIDAQGGWVPQELRARSREEILEVFFREVSKTLVSTLRDSFNFLDPTLRKKTFSKLHEFALQHKMDEETVWDMSEENPKLTEFGALVLLEKAGYIQAQCEDYKEYLEVKNKLVEAKEGLEQLFSIDLTKIDEAKEQVRELKVQLEREKRIRNKENIQKAENALIDAEEKLDRINPENFKTKIAEMQIQLVKMERHLREKSELADVPLSIPSRKDLLDAGGLPLDIRTLGHEIDEKKQLLSREKVAGESNKTPKLQESIHKLEGEVALLQEKYEKACNSLINYPLIEDSS